MAGARPLDTLRLTTGIAIGTLLLSGAILLGPAIRDCSDGEGNLSACLRDKLVDRQLLPQPELPEFAATVPDLPAPPPSVEVAPVLGSLSAAATTGEVVPPPEVDLSGQDMELAIAVTPQLGATGTAALDATGGTIAVTIPHASTPENGTRLNASGGMLSAASGPPEAPNSVAVPFDGPPGSLTADAAYGALDPTTTANLSAPAATIAGADAAPQALPPIVAPFGETAGTLSASASTAADNQLALAMLTPLEAPEPPPLPRPREDDPPPVVDPPPAPEPAPVPPPRPEPAPPPFADDPDFPSVTVLPPPATGENSSIITLTLGP
ncbi:MAG TPA: hypothetical protein VG757_02450 [Devosia sp.]|nr:hypothetical protein [Devosia sp.]